MMLTSSSRTVFPNERASSLSLTAPQPVRFGLSLPRPVFGLPASLQHPCQLCIDSLSAVTLFVAQLSQHTCAPGSTPIWRWWCLESTCERIRDIALWSGLQAEMLSPHSTCERYVPALQLRKLGLKLVCRTAAARCHERKRGTRAFDFALKTARVEVLERGCPC